MMMMILTLLSMVGHAIVLFMVTIFFMVPSIASLIAPLLSIYVRSCQPLLKESANPLKIDAKLVRCWVTHYYLTGEIIFSRRNQTSCCVYIATNATLVNTVFFHRMGMVKPNPLLSHLIPMEGECV